MSYETQQEWIVYDLDDIIYYTCSAMMSRHTIGEVTDHDVRIGA